MQKCSFVNLTMDTFSAVNGRVMTEETPAKSVGKHTVHKTGQSANIPPTQLNHPRRKTLEVGHQSNSTHWLTHPRPPSAANKHTWRWCGIGFDGVDLDHAQREWLGVLQQLLWNIQPVAEEVVLWTGDPAQNHPQTGKKEFLLWQKSTERQIGEKWN